MRVFTYNTVEYKYLSKPSKTAMVKIACEPEFEGSIFTQLNTFFPCFDNIAAE